MILESAWLGLRKDMDLFKYKTSTFTSMGVDKKNIRTVIHLSPPSSVEAYLQESRAGFEGWAGGEGLADSDSSPREEGHPESGEVEPRKLQQRPAGSHPHRTAEIRRAGLEKVRGFGVLTGWELEDVEVAIDTLVRNGDTRYRKWLNRGNVYPVIRKSTAPDQIAQ